MIITYRATRRRDLTYCHRFDWWIFKEKKKKESGLASDVLCFKLIRIGAKAIKCVKIIFDLTQKCLYSAISDLFIYNHYLCLAPLTRPRTMEESDAGEDANSIKRAPLARLSVIAPSSISLVNNDTSSNNKEAIESLSSSSSNKPKIPDGGWGWMVVLSSSILCLIQDGISFSFGILFTEFTVEFEASKTEASWIGSLFVSVPLITGPIMSALVDRYGCRNMTILAGITSASGFILSYFVRDIKLMYLTFGIISGLGLGLTFVTAVVSIAFWFEKKRNLAVGLGACGVGIGTFVYAPFTSYLINEFGWRWSVVLLGGTLLNMCVCGALMRDPDWVIQQNKAKTKSGSLARDENKKLLTSHEDDLMNRTENSDGIAVQSLLDLPTYLKQNEATISAEVLRKLTSNKDLYKVIYENYPHLLLNNAAGDNHQDEKTKSSKNNNNRPYYKNLRFNRRSFTHHRSMHKLKVASSCPDMYRVASSDYNNESNVNNNNNKNNTVKNKMNALKELFDFALFFDFHFFLMSLSTIILFAWFMTPYFYLADHMEITGYTKNEASITMAIMGATSTLGMVLLGWAGDQEWCNVPKMYAACLVLCGVCCSLQTVFSKNFVLLNLASASYGFFLASSFSFTPVVLTLLVPLEVFTKAYGLTLLCQGIGHLAGPPVAAFLFDVYQIWDYSFHLSAVWIIISGLLLVAIPYTKNFKIFGIGDLKHDNDSNNKTVRNNGDVEMKLLKA